MLARGVWLHMGLPLPPMDTLVTAGKRVSCLTSPCGVVECWHAFMLAGQFGTRLQGGKDSAGARYIMTRLAPIARAVFHEHDDALLAYLREEGQSIEPTWCVLPYWHSPTAPAFLALLKSEIVRALRPFATATPPLLLHVATCHHPQ